MPIGRKVCAGCGAENGTRSKACAKCAAPFPAARAKSKPRKQAARKAKGRNLPAVRKPRVEKMPFLPALAHSADGPCLVMTRGGAFAQLSAAETRRVADTLFLVFEAD